MESPSTALQEKILVSRPEQASPESAATKSGGRILELDGLRGIAALMVVVFHYVNNQLVTSSVPGAGMLSKLTEFGWVGVDLFFVLSGFLIGSILIRNKPSKQYFSTFFVRRVVRIVPNYFLAVGLFILITNLSFFKDNYFLTSNNVIPWWSYFAMVHNIYMGALQNLGNQAMSITWSIGIEEQFYIIFPFIIYYLKDKWLPWVLIACIITAGIVRGMMPHWITGYVLLPCRMDGLALGVLIAWLMQRTDLATFVKRNKFPLIGAMLVNIMFCAITYYKFGDLGPVKHTLFAFFFAIAMLFALTLKNSWYAAALRMKWLTWIGTISYSLYLFHYLTLGVVHQFAGNDEIGIYNTADIGISIMALAIAIGFSWLVYTVLESRFVNFGKRFRY